MTVASDARIVAAQTVPHFGALERNRKRTVDIVRTHPDADLVVFPELATSGYVFESAAEVESMAEPRDGKTAQAWTAVASETDTWIVGGFPEEANGCYYNSALVVSPNGVEGVYRKVHRWNEEKRWFEPGSELPVFETPFGRLGVQICNDQWFPESTITQARHGADLIAVPTNWVPDPGAAGGNRPAGWTMGVHQAVAHANANQVCIVCADRAGTERGVTFEGQSVVLDANGSPLAGPVPAEEEHVIETTCDLTQSREKALTARDDALADRRPETYDLDTHSG